MKAVRHQLIGVEISTETIKACLFDCCGTPCLSVDLKSPQPLMPGAVTVALCEGIMSIDPFFKADYVGVSLPGKVDHQGRIALSCDEMPGWIDVPFADWLELRLSKKVVLINSSRCLDVGVNFSLKSNLTDDKLLYTQGAAILAFDMLNSFH